MGLVDILGDPSDGSLGSGDTEDPEGNNSSWQYDIRAGENVFLAGDDPSIGLTMMAGAYMT